ncbi:hypothetical protein KUTeg_009909 [Tegillarca granosa]|uniref:F-box only protein 21 n=1 Tax=Tegillarca granosa TaxID=220873 RepID=A0ABQ9F8I4_TEGGR|nr:hypothetical protein KUTeg_009909 [Tegillarca granosa]
MDSTCPSDIGSVESHRQLQELPNELIEHILLNNCIQIRDVCSVAKACKNLHFVCQSNELWKQKLKQRWPKLLSRYKRNQTYNWHQEVEKCYSVGKIVRQLLQKLSPKFYKVEAISDDGFRDFDKLIDEFQSEEIVINQLMEVLHDNRSHENLTNKYYAAKVIRYILHSQLRKAWDNYLELPADQQSPEIGAVMIAQWCQPTVNITENDISDQLDKLAEETKCDCPDTIRNLYTKHELDGKFPMFSPQQEQVILETMNHVLYTKHEFAGNAGDYYDEKNSYIDQVLSRHVGIPITLSIIYNSVAARLGIHLDFVNFPGHFLLKWKEHPMAQMDQQYTFIDAFNNGRFLKRTELASTFHLPDEILQSPDIFISTQPLQLFFFPGISKNV